MEAKGSPDAAPPEAKEASKDAKSEAKDADDAPVAPALRVVAKYFAQLRADLGDAAADCDGIECIYGDWLAENADEFEEFVDGCGGDGAGNSHDMHALHGEFLALFSKDVERAIDGTEFTLDAFMNDVEEARKDGLSERWASLEMATGAWFVEALWAALDIAEFAAVMKEAADRQRKAMDRKRAMRLLRRGAK